MCAATTFTADDLTAHSRYLYNYALRQLRDPAAAEDVVQETFVAALAGRTRFAGTSALRTWLTGILKHKIMDIYRDRARTPVSLDALEGDGAADWMTDEANGSDETDTTVGARQTGADPEYAMARKRFWEEFQRHLDRMPAKSAQAFALHEVMGHDTGEVCERLGVTAANLWVMLHRARKSLREVMDPDWMRQLGAAR